MTAKFTKRKSAIALTAANKRRIAPRAGWFGLTDKAKAHSMALRRQVERLRTEIADLRAA